MMTNIYVNFYFRDQLFLDAIFVYILARILTREVITEWIRSVLLTKNFFFLHELFSCPFCMSFWVGTVFCFVFQSQTWTGYRIAFCMLFVSIVDRVLERIK